MSAWNFDISAAPLDGTHVILAMPNKTTLRSYWCKPKGEPEHWCMLSHKNEPVAWILWPEHPFAVASQGEAAAPSVERVTPHGPGSADANAGGGDVTDGENTQPVSAGELVSRSPAFIIDDVGSV